MIRVINLSAGHGMIKSRREERHGVLLEQEWWGLLYVFIFQRGSAKEHIFV